ncbi:MAG: hypothetical protein R3252_05225 [Robiginitalea sp.]|nr:hypothetical protein [Robiginitalea sp.]
MKPQFWIFIVSLALSSSLYGQRYTWSVEAYYPISIGESFGASNEGRVGLGAKYRFAQTGRMRLGASLDAAWFATVFVNDSDPVQELDYRDFFLQPRIFGELPVTSNERLRFLFGLGWTFIHSRTETFLDQQGYVEGKVNNSGPNVNAGLTWNLSPRWFLHSQLDFIYSNGDTPETNIGLLKLGAGFRF